MQGSRGDMKKGTGIYWSTKTMQGSREDMKTGTGIYGRTKTVLARRGCLYIAGYGDIWERKNDTRD